MNSDYQNEAILENIPYNQVYYVEVSVFDANSNSWSQAGVSGLVNMTFDLELSLNNSKHLTTAAIEWKSKNDYKISKLSISILNMNGTNEVAQELTISDEVASTCKNRNTFYILNF